MRPPAAREAARGKPPGPWHKKLVYWCLTDDPKLGPMLRLARDSGSRELLPTVTEAHEQAEARAREAEVQAREAEQRIRELEAELAKRG